LAAAGGQNQRRLNSGKSLECAVDSFEPNLNCRQEHSHLSIEKYL
jgi:hypothetical protein